MWFLIVSLVLTFPQKGDVIFASKFSFTTEQLCNDYIKSVDMNQMIKAVLGPRIRYKDATLICKEVAKPDTPV